MIISKRSKSEANSCLLGAEGYDAREAESKSVKNSREDKQSKQTKNHREVDLKTQAAGRKKEEKRHTI